MDFNELLIRNFKFPNIGEGFGICEVLSNFHLLLFQN